MADTVTIPNNADEAAAMLRVAAHWLHDNAPEVLRATLRASEYAKNAERYCWLRARVSGHRALGSARPATFAFPGTMALPPLGDIMIGSVAQHLDAAIDAAIDEAPAVCAA